MEVIGQTWCESEYCLSMEPGVDAQDWQRLAQEVYARACRTDLSMPGFALIDLGPAASSQQLRRAMVELVQALRQLHAHTTGQRLACLSAGRFDQQVTTKIHRDAAPNESLLLLGYEASPVDSTVALADYSRCARDRSITPEEFLDRFNPMFVVGEQMLAPYTTQVRCFSHQRFQMLAINNSMTPLDSGCWQGVLHTATVLNPNDEHHRVVNSLMLASLPGETPDVVSDDELEIFATSQSVRRRGYDKPHLEEN